MSHPPHFSPENVLRRFLYFPHFDCFHSERPSDCAKSGHAIRPGPLSPSGSLNMCSPLEISFQPQTFQTFLFPGCSNQDILIHCPVVDPSFVLNMGLCSILPQCWLLIRRASSRRADPVVPAVMPSAIQTVSPLPCTCAR